MFNSKLNHFGKKQKFLKVFNTAAYPYTIKHTAGLIKTGGRAGHYLLLIILIGFNPVFHLGQVHRNGVFA